MPAPTVLPGARSIQAWSNGKTASLPRQIEVPILHELAADDFQTAPVERSFVVAPSTEPTKVKITSQVVNYGVPKHRSDTYMATVRRRKAANLLLEFRKLSVYQGNDDFAIYTSPVLDRVRSMLQELEVANQEGNTREVLRLLRDCILNGGWNRLREPHVRDTIVTLLDRLARQEYVEAKDASEAHQILSGLGFECFDATLLDMEVAHADED